MGEGMDKSESNRSRLISHPSWMWSGVHYERVRVGCKRGDSRLVGSHASPHQLSTAEPLRLDTSSGQHHRSRRGQTAVILPPDLISCTGGLRCVFLLFFLYFFFSADVSTVYWQLPNWTRTQSVHLLTSSHCFFALAPHIHPTHPPTHRKCN